MHAIAPVVDGPRWLVQAGQDDMNDAAHCMEQIRVAIRSDGPELARLLTQLGHDTSAAEVEQRWNGWSATSIALVAPNADGTLAGAATLSMMFVLHRPKPVGRITSLVIDEPQRGRGLGRALVAAAEALLVERGCGLVEITSNDRLVQAHAFYRHLGYQRSSIRLAKNAGG